MASYWSNTTVSSHLELDRASSSVGGWPDSFGNLAISLESVRPVFSYYLSLLFWPSQRQTPRICTDGRDRKFWTKTERKCKIVNLMQMFRKKLFTGASFLSKVFKYLQIIKAKNQISGSKSYNIFFHTCCSKSVKYSFVSPRFHQKPSEHQHSYYHVSSGPTSVKQVQTVGNRTSSILGLIWLPCATVNVNARQKPNKVKSVTICVKQNPPQIEEI